MYFKAGEGGAKGGSGVWGWGVEHALHGEGLHGETGETSLTYARTSLTHLSFLSLSHYERIYMCSL